MSHDLEAIAQRALELISEDSVVGLGTGHAATAFIHALGRKVADGFRIRGIPTSQASAELAQTLGIALSSLDEVEAIDVDVDGADEVDPQGSLIKGYGGALVREKIVAAASRRLVILVGEEKLVPQLGAHGRLPVEVVPFALETCARRLAGLGFPSEARRRDDHLFVTDNGNYILDCRIQPLPRPEETQRAIRDIPGVVGTGLFLGMGPTVLIGKGGKVELREYGGDGQRNRR